MRNIFGDDFRQNEDATNWIRIGEVSSVDPKKCTATVVFDDEDGFVSDNLPIIQRNTQNVKDYWLPAVGEDVLCIFLPCGEEDGFIVGSFYADEIEPPTSSESKRYTEYPDGTVIEYDWEAHALTAKGAEKIKVTVPDIEFRTRAILSRVAAFRRTAKLPPWRKRLTSNYPRTCTRLPFRALQARPLRARKEVLKCSIKIR